MPAVSAARAVRPDSARYRSDVSEFDHPPVPVGPWRRRSRRIAYENPWIEVLHDEVDRPDGSPGIYGVVHFRSSAVGVVAVDDEGRILLVGQHRYTLDAYSWEIPEGGVAEGEPAIDGARRELAEETGFAADGWRELCRFSLSNSITDERGVVFLATGLRAGVAAPEPTEDLALRWARPEDVLAEIRSGGIHDIITIAGVTTYALEYREDAR